MHAGMHAEAPLIWKLVAHEEKMQKHLRKLHILYACRHAKAFLSWKPVAPEVKNAFMHAGDSLPVCLCEVLQSLPE